MHTGTETFFYLSLKIFHYSQKQHSSGFFPLFLVVSTLYVKLAKPELRSCLREPVFLHLCWYTFERSVPRRETNGNRQNTAFKVIEDAEQYSTAGFFAMTMPCNFFPKISECYF